MRILLVSINTCTVPFPVYPIGMSIAAKILTKHNHTVHQFDFLTNSQNFLSLYNDINIFSPDIVGISIRTIGLDTIDICKEIVNNIHKKGIKVFLGGSGFSLSSEIFINKTNADFGLIGPAEGNLINFIEQFQQDKNINTKFFKCKNFDYTSGPLYDNKISNYYSQFDYSIPIHTKKGCTHKCSYCVYNFLDGDTLQYRNTKEIINDIKILKKNFNVSKIFFADSIFNDDAGNYKTLLESIIKENLHIKWGAYIYPSNISYADAALMKKSGLDLPILGVDGATDLILKSFNKEFSFEDIIELDKIFLKADIPNSIASFIFGSEMETQDSTIEGVNNIKNLHFKSFDIHIYQSHLYNLGERLSTSINSQWLEQYLIKTFGKIGRVKNTFI